MKMAEYEANEEEKVFQEVIEWVRQNQDPAYKENEILVRYHCQFFDTVPRTKRALSSYYKKRNNLFINYNKWDALPKILRDSYNNLLVGLLPSTNLLGYSVVIGKMKDYSQSLEFNDLQMRILLIAETVQQSDLLNKKNYIVIDYTNITFSFLLKLNLFALQKIYKNWRGYAFISCYEIHHINLPPFSYYIVNLLKYILDEKLHRLNHFHTEDLTEFHKLLPKEIMPRDYGGNAPPLQELSDHWYHETVSRYVSLAQYFKPLSEKAAQAKKLKSFANISSKIFGKFKINGNVA